MAHLQPSSARAVLDTTELLEQICSTLPIESLTRALRVSTHWQRVILGSITLKRQLFLAPAPATLHLEWRKNQSTTKWPYDPFVLTEANPKTRVVVEAHPALASHMNDEYKTCLSSVKVSAKLFSTVHPATFLFQPPVNEVTLRYSEDYEVPLGCDGGVTFGAVASKWEEIAAAIASDDLALEESELTMSMVPGSGNLLPRLVYFRLGRRRSRSRAPSIQRHSGSFIVRAEGVVVKSSVHVQQALKALEEVKEVEEGKEGEDSEYNEDSEDSEDGTDGEKGEDGKDDDEGEQGKAS